MISYVFEIIYTNEENNLSISTFVEQDSPQEREKFLKEQGFEIHSLQTVDFIEKKINSFTLELYDSLNPKTRKINVIYRVKVEE